MTDQYLDYLAGQQSALARQEDEIIALRGKLQASRETYEAFLESRSTNIDPEEVRGILKEARQGEETAAGVPREIPQLYTSCEGGRPEGLPSSPQSPPEPSKECDPTMPAAGREDYVRANASRITSTGEQETANGSDHTQDGMPATGEHPPRRPDRDGEGGDAILRVRDRQNHADSQRQSEEEAPAKSAIGAERRLTREPVPKSAPREAQPADEPYDAGPMPGFLRKARV